MEKTIPQILNIAREKPTQNPKMANFIDAINQLNVGFTINIGNYTIENFYVRKHCKYELRVTGTLYCCYRHIQFLKELGVNMDFSNKRVGFQNTQKHIGSQNECAIKVTMSEEVFLKLNPYFRSNSNFDLSNDYCLSELGYKKKVNYSHVWLPNEIFAEKLFLLIQKITTLRTTARSIKHSRKRTQKNYGFNAMPFDLSNIYYHPKK